MLRILSEDGKVLAKLKREDCTPLELKLNVTTKGHEWGHIGDILFEYGSGRGNAMTSITVTEEQYAFLQTLQARRSWEECRNL
jgi:hypothetical protein